MPTYTYKSIGVNADTIIEVHADATVDAHRSDEYVVTTIPDDYYRTDLDAYMMADRFERIGAGNLIPDEIVPVVRQTQAAKLSADASAVNGGALTPSAWTDVLSQSITTTASARLKIEASCNAGVSLGGSARVVITGGAYSDVVLGACTYPILTGNAPGQVMTYEDPAAGTYTVKVQIQAVAVGSVTARAGSTLMLTEYAI